MTERILVCTLGATPQVATETVWALINDVRRPWTPTRIDIVTTTRNLGNISGALQRCDGPLAALFPAGIPPVAIYVPRMDASGVLEPLEIAWHGGDAASPEIAALDQTLALGDVMNAREAEAMGDLIKDRIWAAIEPGEAPGEVDGGTELHVSLAGGRKTMSAHALMALALVGRVQDEASHVLVAPEAFENHGGFWHKAQIGWLNTLDEVRDSKFKGMPLPPPTLNPADAEITLIRVPTPFVTEIRAVDRAQLARLRLSEIIRQIDLANTYNRDPRIEFHDATNEVTVCGTRGRLTAVMYTQLRFLAAARKECWPGAGPGGYLGHEGWVTYQMLTTEVRLGFDPVANCLWPIMLRAVKADNGEIEFDSVRNKYQVDHLNKIHNHVISSNNILQKKKSLGEQSRRIVEMAIAKRIDVRHKKEKPDPLLNDDPASRALMDALWQHELDIAGWFGSLTEIQAAMAKQFGLPAANQIILKVPKKGAKKPTRGENPVLRFGISCPPDKIKFS